MDNEYPTEFTFTGDFGDGEIIDYTPYLTRLSMPNMGIGNMYDGLPSYIMAEHDSVQDPRVKELRSDILDLCGKAEKMTELFLQTREDTPTGSFGRDIQKLKDADLTQRSYAECQAQAGIRMLVDEKHIILKRNALAGHSPKLQRYEVSHTDTHVEFVKSSQALQSEYTNPKKEVKGKIDWTEPTLLCLQAQFRELCEHIDVLIRHSGSSYADRILYKNNLKPRGRQ